MTGEEARAITRTRRKICFRLAEMLEPDGDYDIDVAAKTLEAILPMTHSEADAELEILRKVHQPTPLGPTPMERIRKAVYATPDMSLRTILIAVAERLEHENETRAQLASPRLFGEGIEEAL